MRLHLVNDASYAILENGLCLWSGEWRDRPDSIYGISISDNLLSLVEKDGWIDIVEKDEWIDIIDNLPILQLFLNIKDCDDYISFCLCRGDTVSLLWSGLYRDLPSYLTYHDNDIGSAIRLKERSIDISLPDHFDLYRLEGDYGSDTEDDDIPYILSCFGYEQYFIDGNGHIWVVLDIAHVDEMLELIDGRIWRSKWTVNFVPVILGGVQ